MGGVGHQQNGPPRPEQDCAGVIVARAAPAADDEEIRRSCFPQKQLTRRFGHAAPFGLLEMVAAGAKRFAPLLETRHHLLKVVLTGGGQPNISGHEHRPQRATGSPISAA
jgi:hypothetical protein